MRRHLSTRFLFLAGCAGLSCGVCVEAQAQLSGSFVDVKPVRGQGVNTPALEGPWSISADGLTLYFMSDRPWMGERDDNRLDLYEATRADKNEPFRSVQELVKLNTPFGDASPQITHDGFRLYFASNRPGAQTWDLWVATREKLREPFRDATNEGILTQVNSLLPESAPAISCDETILIFQRYQGPGEGEFDLWIATRDTAEGPFGTPERLPDPVNTEFSDGLPSLSCDGLTLFFSDYSFWFSMFGRRPGGRGGDDIWVTWREHTDQPFGNEPVNLVDFGPRLSSEYNDLSPSIGFDWPEQGSVLLFASDRPHPLATGIDIHQATWLASPDVTIESERPLDSGAINCGGWDIDPPPEIGRFERDRLFRDDVSWEGDAQAGFVVTQTVLGHETTDPEDPSRGIVWSRQNPRAVDVGEIPGAGTQTARLFATNTWSPDNLHYKSLVVPGRYEVTLYFAEGSPDAVDGVGQGTRLVDVFLGGEKVLCNWSAAAAAGSVTGSGNPQIACNALLDTAVARVFTLDVPDDDPADDQASGMLDIVLESSAAAALDMHPSLSAFRFERTGEAAGAPPSGDIECVQLDPQVDLTAGFLDRARDRWQASQGELFINCGGPLLACSATEHPAPGATQDAETGDPVVWIGDLSGGANLQAAQNEFFTVTPLDNGDGTNDGLRVITTDMGFWDARGTWAGWDQNDRIFHGQRLGDVEYEIPVEAGDYELTLYFANASLETAGTAQRFFRIEIEGEGKAGDDTMTAFPHCPFSAPAVINPLFDHPDLYDPMDHAEGLYSPDPCRFAECEVSTTAGKIDPDGDEIPASRECGNAAAVALVYTATVDDGALTIAVREPDTASQPASTDMSPSIAAISVRRRGAPAPFTRGDCNADSAINLTDAVFLLNYLFRGGPAPTCMEACNSDAEGAVNLTDGVYLLNHLFQGGPAIPPPAACEVLEDADCRAFLPCR